MKLPSFKSLLLGLSIVAGIVVMSSCNKGYGCPTDFSVDACTTTTTAPTGC